MADLTLVKSYLREAATGGRSTTSAQLTWLEARRVELHAEVSEGDWAITAQGNDGVNHSASRSLNARDRLDAVMAAMEKLEEQSGVAVHTSRGGVLIPQLAGGLHR